MTGAGAAGRRDFPSAATVDGAQFAAYQAAAQAPSAARPAATVLVVRDAEPRAGSGCAVEVYMLRRVASMAFAPTMWVFPGGGVDPLDGADDVPWAGPGPGWWAMRLGVTQERAAALVVAAAREVFEECGVLLAGPDATGAPADVQGEQWQRDRRALLAREMSFGALLGRRGLVLRTDLLSLRDHWVTPSGFPRRYDTWFFAALLPSGQQTDDRTSEADAGEWIDPAQMLARAADGSRGLMPPTVVNLERLARATSAARFVAEQPEVVTVAPELTREGDEYVLRARLGSD